MRGLSAACLPFPRGSTANADGLLTLGDTTLQEFEGKLFEVPDTQHGTSQPVVLMIVQNDTGSAITVARKMGEFSVATSLDHARRIGTFPCNTAGAVAVPLDDAYTVGATIADNDLFYVVVRGWCSIGTPAAVNNFAAGMSVSSDNGGFIGNAAASAASYFVVGTLDYAASYTANSTAKVFIDALPLKAPPAAG